MKVFLPRKRGSVTCSLSLTPGFSRVMDNHATWKPFQRFHRAGQTVETVRRSFEHPSPG
jgi:hypothetical protein